MSKLTYYDSKQKQYIRLASRLAVDNKLGKLEILEGELGCPLEVLYEIKKSKQIYIDTYIVQKPSGANTSIVKGMYNVIGIDILKNQIQCLAQFSDCYMEFYVSMNEYEVGWFLKEDKSE